MQTQRSLDEFKNEPFLSIIDEWEAATECKLTDATAHIDKEADVGPTKGVAGQSAPPTETATRGGLIGVQGGGKVLEG